MVIVVCMIKKKDCPDEKVDITVFQDSARTLREMAKVANARAEMWLHVADSVTKRNALLKKKLSHDKQTIEAFTPTSAHLWNDSVLKSAGLK